MSDNRRHRVVTIERPV